MSGAEKAEPRRPGGGRARRTGWLLVFAAAMGFLEAAVVVYLREIYYPGGFRFPIVPMPMRIFVVELLREGATIGMILAIAALAGRDALDRFFVFGLVFGVWDLAYYASLRAALGWPESPGTWDILFLIPVPWLSPVLYPAIVSVFLIAGYAVHEALGVRGRTLRLGRREWALASAGAATIVVSFCWRFRDVVEQRLPGPFPARLYLAGLAIAVLPFARAAWRGLRGGPAPR